MEKSKVGRRIGRAAWTADLNRVLRGTSLVVQWLRLCAPNAEGPGLIPGQGNRSHTSRLRLSTAKYINKYTKTHTHTYTHNIPPWG